VSPPLSVAKEQTCVTLSLCSFRICVPMMSDTSANTNCFQRVYFVSFIRYISEFVENQIADVQVFFFQFFIVLNMHLLGQV